MTGIHLCDILQVTLVIEQIGMPKVSHAISHSLCIQAVPLSSVHSLSFSNLPSTSQPWQLQGALEHFQPTLFVMQSIFLYMHPSFDQQVRLQACMNHDNTITALCCRAIYDQSYEDIAWHVGDNNGMPSDSRGPMSDLAQTIAHHETPPDPIPSTSGRNSNDSTSSNSSESNTSNSEAGGGKKSDGLKASISSKVQSALRQAAHMDSVPEDEQAKSNKWWRRSSALQTIALDSEDLPNSPPSSSSLEVSPWLY